MSTHDYKVRPWGPAFALDFIIDGELIAIVPFTGERAAEEFGAEWKHRNDREAAISRHPAGKRRLTEPAR